MWDEVVLTPIVSEALLVFQDLDKLLKQLDEMRSNLADETLMRVELENKLVSIQEEMQFKESVR